MRIPWWLRKISPHLIKTRTDLITKPHWIDVMPEMAKFPEHYQRRYTEAQTRTPRPVHYLPATVTHVYDREHGIIKQVDETQSIDPIFPPEADYGLWGGEGIIKGFTRRKKKAPRNPHWWAPNLRECGFYSEILDKHYKIVVTGLALDRIDEAHGFDFYILKTHEVDLRSRLGMRLKREMLLTLARKSFYPHDPEKRDLLLDKYKDFILPEEETEWIGLTPKEAMMKYNKTLHVQPVPLKEILKEQLLLELNRRKKALESGASERSEGKEVQS